MSDANGSGAWERLRRRKVVEWSLAYLAAAWVLLQVIGFVADAFHWPDASKRYATLILAAGLPVAVALAWFHGDRGQQRVSLAEVGVLTLLLLSGGALLWWTRDSGLDASDVPAVDDGARAAESAPGPSIAVLPFENRSRLEDDAFFVDGIHDDILTQLAKIGALKVIARTSVEQFRDTNLAMSDIGRQLGVATVLEGGVQRAGDRVRIHVQLIDATTDAHLWAESYDRELTAANIFAIQSEVATAIANALEATLTPAESAVVELVPTRNLAAWEAYQLGKQRMARRTSTGLDEAAHYFETAIAHDPEFALAYVGLADAVFLRADYGGISRAAASLKSEELLKQAMKIEPNSAEAHASAASIAVHRGDSERSDALFRRAIELNPNYASAHHWYALMLQLNGRPFDALQHADRALELDPLSPIIVAYRAGLLAVVGRYAEAQAANLKAIEIDPGFAVAHVGMGMLLADGFGRLDLAIPWLEKASALDPSSSEPMAGLARYYHRLGDDAAAGRWLARALEVGANSTLVNEVAALIAFEQGDAATARRYATAMAAADPRRFWLLKDIEVRSGDYAAALRRYATHFPELLTPGAPEVNGLNHYDAIDLSLVLQSSSQPAQAALLLDRAEEIVGRFPRIATGGAGVGWYVLQDASIHALRGERAKAVARLREAREAGWWAIDYVRDFDPNFASLRNDSRFRELFEEIAAGMAEQRARLAARAKDAPLETLLPRE